MIGWKAFILSVVSALVLATPSFAATLNITSFAGYWQAVDAEGHGAGTDTVYWGNDHGWDTGSGHSSFFYDPNDPLSVDENVQFSLGTFIHNNVPIYPDAISWADLYIEMTIEGVAEAVTAVIDFGHWETINGADVCANGENGVGVNINGCSDRVTISTLADTSAFELDGVTYFLDVAGLLAGGDVITEFWTQEESANEAEIVAAFRTLGSEIPPEVPLPATGWLLLGGLAGLTLARRRL